MGIMLDVRVELSEKSVKKKHAIIAQFPRESLRSNMQRI